MHSPRKTSGFYSEQWASVEPRLINDWEAAHIFLEVVRSGSFRMAAQKLQQSVNILRRRIDRFERELGVTLLRRHTTGLKPTKEGSRIYEAALRMESASLSLIQTRTSQNQIEGEVRLSITEGMGTYWLVPCLAEFLRVNSGLTVNLACEQKPLSLLRLQADLSIQLERPKEPDLKIVKLGRLHLMPFAAQSYLDTHGYPADASDLAGHRLVVVSDDERQWQNEYQKMFHGISPRGLISLRNNLSSAHVWSVVQGMGIGFLPTYLQALGIALVPLAFGNESRDIWLVYRPEAKRVARLRRTIDWIIQSYNPRHFPWFRHEFIHPDRFADIYSGPVPPSLSAEISTLK
jgi:DNA-binding transcriptional LysR family regulator